MKIQTKKNNEQHQPASPVRVFSKKNHNELLVKVISSSLFEGDTDNGLCTVCITQIFSRPKNRNRICNDKKIFKSPLRRNKHFRMFKFHTKSNFPEIFFTCDIFIESKSENRATLVHSCNF